MDGFLLRISESGLLSFRIPCWFDGVKWRQRSLDAVVAGQTENVVAQHMGGTVVRITRDHGVRGMEQRLGDTYRNGTLPAAV